MCGIAGFYNPHDHYLKEKEHYESVLQAMAERLRHRGPDDAGRWLSEHGGLSHARLSIIDLAGGHQPMVKSGSGQTFAIVYNGELYNTDELRQELMAAGYSFQTSSDTEVILAGYMEYGPDFVKRLNGIFAFAIMDTALNRLCLFRDRAGVKPLFYTIRGEELIFSSELKGILAYPGVKAQLDRRGLNEVFSVGPARTYGCGVLKDMEELLPGHYLICTPDGIRQQSYWKLVSRPHEDSYERTIEKTSFLVEDSVRRQMVSDVPICTFLSGGVDSSLVSAICAKELKKQGIEVHLLTGDGVRTAERVSAALGIDHYKAEVMPNDKEEYIVSLQRQGKKVAMVGDGINDSQALARADVSIAMVKGTDIAMDVAMVTLITSDLLLLPDAIRLSKQTVRLIYQNLFWAFIYNVIGIPLAAGVLFPINGLLLNPMLASAAMAFSSVSVVLNSLRLKFMK